MTLLQAFPTHRLALFLLAFVVSACSSGVTRQESIQIAQSYCQLQWTAKPEQAHHGLDPNGVRVDTPDIAFKNTSGRRPGWWVPNRINIGVPYQWGGFDTPESFQKKLQSGAYAGDVYTPEKRRLNNTAVSQYACGVDCSGFISRCWKLNKPYSTNELPQLCDPLPNFDSLRPGDLINKADHHALLFAGFADHAKTEILAYESGCPPTWKTLYHHMPLQQLKDLGYLPYRYKNIRD